MFDAQLDESVPCGITTHADDGSNVDADSLPTITVYRNGSAVGALTAQAMTKLATGLYEYSFTPTTAGGFASGDSVKVVATSIIDGVTSSIDLKELKVTAWRTSAGVRLIDGAITSAKITVSTISGVASGWIEKMDQLWRRFFKKVVHDQSGETLKTYADDASTVLTTQTLAEDEDNVETQGAAT